MVLKLKKFFWPSTKKVNTKCKIWRPARCSGKKQYGNHSKRAVPIFFRGEGGNHKAENCRDMMADFVQSYKVIGFNMSSNVQLVDSPLDFFPENFGAESDKHGERFHQDISTMEMRYQGQWSPSTLADYCWTLRRHVPRAESIRK